MIKYSIIVLLEEPGQDFPQYIKTLYEIFSRRNEPFEVIIMANGLRGYLKNILTNLHEQLTKFADYEKKLRLFALPTRTSQAVFLNAGFKESSGKIIVVCGSYLQITKESLGLLLDSFDKETDIISPWRQKRVDPKLNQWQSAGFNWLVKKITGSTQHDLSCTVKICRRQVLEDTRLYGNMYRFLPIIAARKGFKNKEVKCDHFQERGKTGIYGVSAYVGRLLDILTLYFNTRFSRKPLRFFGNIGLSFITMGVLISLIVLVQKIFMGYPIGGHPILLLAVLLLVLGVQAASVGLLGEIIAFTQGRQIKEYNIDKII
ncbi:hypothetical protein MNBD_DELTA03-1712 [hydrothermal vent metagenome]|uniref:Glycosyltransferase 2-like domain-containing protein n=1 Tax=hydrothermal vent metagenome TaxID=652676 RepID=A0A3B0V739_9ZZZZ